MMLLAGLSIGFCIGVIATLVVMSCWAINSAARAEVVER